ncbi:MAG: hypothetical protein Q9182_005657 [Xanthomendoza sp. 2 TL-2023]
MAHSVDVVLLQDNQGSDTRRGTGIALLNTIGQCGPLLGTNIFPSREGPRYTKGMWVSAAFTLLTAFLALGLRVLLVWENKRLDKKYGPRPELVPEKGIDLAAVQTAVGIPNTVHQQDSWTLDIVDSRMCFHQIQKYGCGHEDKDLIPCEEKCDTDKCSKPGQDQVVEGMMPECAKCKYAADDQEDIQRQIREFTMKESLKPSAAPTTAKLRDPNRPKRYLIMCIEWQRCKRKVHLTNHPEQTMIEWENEEVPQYMSIPGRGQCFDCSRAPAGKIQAMKENGEYEKQDPWGAMSKIDVGEGSSSNVHKHTLEQIAAGVAAGQDQHNDFPASCSPSPKGRRQRSVSFESDDDTGHSKGKSRKGEAVDPQPHDEREESDEEEEEDEEEEDTEEEQSVRIPNWSTASSAKAVQVPHKSKGAPHSHSREYDDSDEESGDESELDEIGHVNKAEKK